MRNRKMYASLGGVLMLGTMAIAGTAANGATTHASSPRPVGLDAQLRPLNNSGGHGHGHVVVNGRRAHVHIDAFHLAKGLPHAQQTGRQIAGGEPERADEDAAQPPPTTGRPHP